MSSGRLPVVKPVALRVRVAEAIRQALLEGQFSPGENLSEVSLAREMNVSRGPVREALLVLAQEGLITHSQNYGFSVLGFTDEDHTESDNEKRHCPVSFRIPCRFQNQEFAQEKRERSDADQRQQADEKSNAPDRSLPHDTRHLPHIVCSIDLTQGPGAEE